MPPPKASVRGEYIETETGNKISRRASILGPKHIILAGKCVIQHDAVLHGDLVRPPSNKATTSTSTSKANDSTTTSKSAPASASAEATTSIHLGRYVFISPSCVLHPPSRLTTIPSPTGTTTPASTQITTYYPLRIQDHVFIGPFTTIRAAEIRSNVYIGAHCVIGNMVIIKEDVKVLDHTVLPANSVWSSGVVIGGRPGRVLGEVGEGWGESIGGGGGGPGGGGSAGKWGGVGEAGVGVRARERYAGVGNRKG